MDNRNRLLVGFAVAAVILGALVASIVQLGLRAPATGEILPCGHLARTVFELGGVKKAVCVNGHAWTHFQGRWVDAADPLASPPAGRSR
jgi:hypothetical protein